MSDNSILEGNNCVSLYEIENEIVWHKFNTSMSSFCCNVIKSTNQTDKLVCCIVGEDVDWIGINSLALFCNSVTGLKREIFDIQNRYSQLDRQLKYHEKTSKEIVNQLRQANKQYQDREWQLQESLVHTENVLKLEMEGTRMLKDKNSSLEEKLTEVEYFMSSERGQLCLKLEEELAAAKLGLAELESEKDELMLRLQTIENVTPSAANSKLNFSKSSSHTTASLHGSR